MTVPVLISSFIHVLVLSLIWVMVVAIPRPVPVNRIEVQLAAGALSGDAADPTEPAQDSQPEALQAQPPVETVPQTAAEAQAPAETQTRPPVQQTTPPPATTARPEPLPSPPAQTTDSPLQVPQASSSGTAPRNLRNLLEEPAENPVQAPPGFNPEPEVQQEASRPAQTDSSSANSSAAPGTASADSELADRLARLQQRMASGYTRPPEDAPAATTSTQTAGTDPRISGAPDLQNRSLVVEDRLQLAPLLSVRQSNWPPSIRVEFEVNSEGWVRILNERDFSAYTDLAVAIYELFQGQVFVSAPGTDIQRGSILFQLE